LLTLFLKFAIRPSIRNNKELTRDEVIRSVASIVGPGHKVDLHDYDLLILVEIYKVCSDAYLHTY
jgi:tRNA acetyltransferase TAN1